MSMAEERQSNESWHIAQLVKIANAIGASEQLNESGQKYVTKGDLKSLIPGKHKLTEVFKPINGKQVSGGTDFFYRYKDKVLKLACVTLVSEKPYVRSDLKPTELLRKNLLLKQEVNDLKDELKAVKDELHEAVKRLYKYSDFVFDEYMRDAGGAGANNGGAGGDGANNGGGAGD